MTATNQDDNASANDDCDPGEPRVTYESLSLGEEQCLEVKKKIIPILTTSSYSEYDILILIHTLICVNDKLSQSKKILKIA